MNHDFDVSIIYIRFGNDMFSTNAYTCKKCGYYTTDNLRLLNVVARRKEPTCEEYIMEKVLK